MASDAEVQLLVNASNALRDLERDLDRLVNQAEASADPVLIAATLDRTLALRNMRRDLDEAVRVAQAGAPDIHVRADVDVDDAERQTTLFRAVVRGLGDDAGRLLGPLGGLAGGIAKAGAAAGTAVPLLAGVVVAVESILPAAALATSGLLTLKLATATVQIAMVGVGDAIKTAFDPEATPEELADSLKKLGPHAKSFVKELQGMRKEFKALQIDVQNRLFANLDKSLERTAKSVLPSLHGALDRTADSLNDMARGAATAAQDLGDKGILGTALAHSTGALSKLERVPGQVVTAFGQLAAASGPALEGLATRAGGVADRIAEKLSKAFESGALEKAINVAISNIDQLGRIAGNIFGGIGNIIKSVTVNGEGLFGTLEKVSEAFEKLTASKEFQSALQALSQTMNVLVTTLLPILADAFKALLPIFEIIAPPIQNLIKALGPQIQNVIIKLAPVLEALATAFGKLVPVIEPIISLALQLIADILPVLTPLFEFLGEVFERLAPVIQQVADNIASQLEPILAELPGILEQILPQFLEIVDKIFPLLLDLLVQLSPSLIRMAEALAELLVALTPLIVKFLEFQVFLLEKMGPAMQGVTEFIGTVFVGVLDLFVGVIKGFVIPAIESIVALLNGDFAGAMGKGMEITQRLRDVAGRAFTGLKDHAIQEIQSLASRVVGIGGDLQRQFVSKIANLVQGTIELVNRMPGLILSALANLGNLLFNLGGQMIQGLINGITSRIGGVVAAAQAVANAIPSTVKGLLGIHSPSTVMIGVGNDTMAGLLKGIKDSGPALRKELSGVALAFPQNFARPVGSLSTASLNARHQVVNVFVGNQLLTRHIDYRIDTANRRSTLVTAQGVRR